MAKKNQEKQQDQIVAFKGAEYKYSKLSEQGKVVVTQLNIIEHDILETKMLLARHEAARKTFVAAFEEIVDGTKENE